MAGDTAKVKLSEKLGSEFRLRVVSGVVLAVVGVAAIVLGGWVCAIWIGLVCAAMAWEWMNITWLRADITLKRSVAALTGAAVVISYFTSIWSGIAIACGILALCYAAGRHRISGARWTFIGLFLLITAGAEFVWLRGEEMPGLMTTLWLVLVVAATDIGGFFAGRLIGGPKLAPRISPKKTWSGVGGGLLLSALTGVIFSFYTSGTTTLTLAVLSIVMSAAAIMGDLFESSAKRTFGVKDAGSLLPGHGGFCDRFDGLMGATLALTVVALLTDGDKVVW